MDPAIGLLGAALIAVWAVGLLRETSATLLDAAVDDDTVAEIKARREADADNRVSDLHVWSVGGQALTVAVSIVTRDPRHLANRLATGLVSGSLWWALCEIAWNGAPDAETALWWVKTSALGWVAIGPLGLHLFLEVTGEPVPLLRRRLPWLYACSVLFLAVDWSTDWIHTGVVRTSWGWAYELGRRVFLLPWLPVQ